MVLDFGLKLKALLELLEALHSKIRKVWIQIWHEHLTILYSKPKMILKVKSCRIYLNFIYEPICRCKMQIWHQLFIIIYLLIKNKSEQSSTKFKASLNLHQSLHTRQFEDSEYKSDITKCFSNLNPNLSKCLSSVHLLRDQLENSLRHLHGNYKQGVEDKCDPNFLVRWKFPRKSM